MTLLEAQSSIIERLVADVVSCWDPVRLYTDQPILPPGSQDLPEAYINLGEAILDQPEQQRLTAFCLGEMPMHPIRLDVEIALREQTPEGEPTRLQLHRQAAQLRRRVLWDESLGQRRLYAGVPAYWNGESYVSDDLDGDPQAEDCLLRVRFYFVVTVALA